MWRRVHVIVHKHKESQLPVGQDGVRRFATHPHARDLIFDCWLKHVDGGGAGGERQGNEIVVIG